MTRMTIGQYMRVISGGTEMVYSKPMRTLLIFGTITLSLLIGCRRLGFYDPVYSQTQLQKVLDENRAEFDSLAVAWLSQHKSDSIQYLVSPNEHLVLNRMQTTSASDYPKVLAETVHDLHDGRFKLEHDGSSEIVPAAGVDRSIGFSQGDFNRIWQFAQKYKLNSLAGLSQTGDNRNWYLQMSFQGGGSRWPYGLIYIPEDEPLDLLMSANSGPGPGFSKLTPIGGRWLYYESGK